MTNYKIIYASDSLKEIMNEDFSKSFEMVEDNKEKVIEKILEDDKVSKLKNDIRIVPEEGEFDEDFLFMNHLQSEKEYYGLGSVYNYPRKIQEEVIRNGEYFVEDATVAIEKLGRDKAHFHFILKEE